ncbi:uncharacterized protein LOC125858875 [Solanum stenotomum]|uniref:uncharacterized protein LOC125858875 n=1 Tax=Solanum stenotomum TaxID=172797 RepID=UPI0020D1CB87|nr:uncharacterized protein LOC125858875 [Solanum stenotomum]
MGELKTGRGLNQELGLVKIGDTRWGYHYKSFVNFISSFDSIVDVLDTLVESQDIAKCHDSCKGSKEKLQQLNDRFNEVTSDFLNGVSCLNPLDSFSSFDIKKIMRMAELYPDDFDESNMRALENQLVNYIIDVHDIDEMFSNLGGLWELSIKLVWTKKHLNYSLVFLLVKFDLLLPIVTATVERAFSAMKIIKNDLQS